MKLNQELLNKIREELNNELTASMQVPKWWDKKFGTWPETCRRYSEQIIKCTECDGSGEHEINVDGVDGPSANDCFFCEGKGYLEE